MSQREEDPALIHLKAEKISVGVTPVAGDTVVVSTKTVERHQIVDETLTHTDVSINRVAIGKFVESTPPVREEGDTTILSIVEEIITIERRLYLKEEVHIERTLKRERYVENVPVRSQEVVIERRRHADRGSSRLSDKPLEK